MNTAYKKISGYLLLGIIAAPLLFAIFFVAKQQYIHFEIDGHLAGKKLTTIHIPLKNLHWVRYGKELQINGNMVDVESLEINEETATIKGFIDEKETQLLDQLTISLKVKNNTSNNNTSAKFIFLPFFSQQPATFDLIAISEILEKKYGLKNIRYTSALTAITTPPPKELS